MSQCPVPGIRVLVLQIGSSLNCNDLEITIFIHFDVIRYCGISTIVRNYPRVMQVRFGSPCFHGSSQRAMVLMGFPAGRFSRLYESRSRVPIFRNRGLTGEDPSVMDFGVLETLSGQALKV
jgi:hypothetical protein